MKWIARGIFLTLAALLWAAVLLVGFEIYHAVRWNRIETENPYVRSRIEGLPWPGADADQFGSQTQPPGDAINELAQRFPPEVPLVVWGRRLEYLIALPREDRASLAGMYKATLIQVDFDGTVLDAYPDCPLEGDAPDLGTYCTVARTRRFLESAVLPELKSGLPRNFHLDGEGEVPGLDIFVFSGGDASHAVESFWIIMEEEKPAASVSPVWKIPFFTYREHASRSPEQPNLNSMGVEQFSLNNLGFRDTDVEIPKPDGVVRVVCIGASTTEEGPTNALTYPNILERKLRAHFNTGRIDVINCGISGMTVQKEFLRLADYLAMEPDIAIIYEGVNDICHLHFRNWVETATWWQRILRVSAFLTYSMNGALIPSDTVVRADLEAKTISKLRQMCQYMQAKGVQPVLCTFARPDIANLSDVDRDYYDYYNWKEWGGRYITFATYCRVLDELNAMIRALAQELAVPCVPVSENVRGGTVVFGDICHMKNVGIERKASVLFDHVVNMVSGLLASDNE